jgi:DNA-binding NtrC family response regulator
MLDLPAFAPHHAAMVKSGARNTVLVIDDEPGIRFGIATFLRSKGFAVNEAATFQEGLESFKDKRPSLVVADYSLPDGNGLDLLGKLRELDDEVPVVMLTGHATVDLAVRALKEGAENFLTKPLELPALLVVVERALKSKRTAHRLEARVRGQSAANPFLGSSDAIRRLADEAQQIAETDSPVLILGETGTGKGVLARWLHAQGPRAKEAMVSLNCASLSRELLESELFGHEKGAFTGAVGTKVGLFEVADAGTMFLDEIGDIGIEVQPRLLTVLEEHRFRRIGGVADRQVDVRLIAATHQDLTARIAEKKFRSDLYYRINTLPIVIPPLRARPEDIAPLADALLEQLAAQRGRRLPALSSAVLTSLRNYPWPGNVRELRNVLERAVLLCRADELVPADFRFSASVDSRPSPDTQMLTLTELERVHIETVMKAEQGHVERAAARLGISRSSLYEKVKRYGL